MTEKLKTKLKSNGQNLKKKSGGRKGVFSVKVFYDIDRI